MLLHHRGTPHGGGAPTIESIKTITPADVETLDARKELLRDALKRFNLDLANLTEQERKGLLSLLYKEITDVVFDAHLHVASSSARHKIDASVSNSEKIQALREFREITEELASLYQID